jgi:cytochrome b561
MTRLHLTRRLLHWAIALLVLAQIALGLLFTDFDNRPTVEAMFGEGAFDALYDLHKSLGVTILALVVARIAAMLVWPGPPHQPPLPALIRIAAKLNHGGLYALLVLLPLLGWAGVSAFRAPVPVFGLFQAPHLAAENRPVSEFLLGLHGAAAFTLLALIAIHVAAALWHRQRRRDGVFERISFGRRRRG